MSLADKTILILGGTGSLGNALTRRLVVENQIIIYSRGETNQWKMRQRFQDHSKQINFVIGDIRDRDAIRQVVYTHQPQIIIIAAAMKHIDICEKQISECTKTNIDGVCGVIEYLVSHRERGTLSFLETVLYVSTDKACSPINVYGMCKSISERKMAAESSRVADKGMKLVTVRYGNVLGSNGSLLQKYNLIARDSEFEFFGVTDSQMTRFFMSLDESVTLIINAILHGQNGDICIPKIPSYRIMDIAQYYSHKYNKPVKIIGIRPGEKIHECLINEVEQLRTEELDHFLAVHPQIHGQSGISYLSSDHIRPVEDKNGLYVFAPYLEGSATDGETG